MEEKTLDSASKKVASQFDVLLIGLQWCTIDETLDCGDPNMNEMFTAFMENGPLLRIFIRVAQKWYADQHEGIRLIFEKLEIVLPQLMKCLESLDREKVSNWHGNHVFYKKLWRKSSHMLHGGVVYINGLIKREAEKVFQVPNPQLANLSLKTHQLLGVFLYFVRANFEELLKSNREDATNSLLLKLKTDTIASNMNQIARITEDLSFLITFLGDTPLHHPESQDVDVLDDIEVVANKAGDFCFKFFKDHKMSCLDVGLILSDLLQKVELVKAKIKVYVEEFQPTVSATNSRANELVVAFGKTYLDYLNVIQHNPDLILKIEIFTEELEFLTHFLMKQPESEDMTDLVAHFAEVREKAEYLINSFAVQGCPAWYFDLRFSQVIEEIQLIKKNKTQIEEKNTCGSGGPEAAVEISGEYSSQAVNPVSTTKVMEDFVQEEEIMNHLLSEESGLSLISIVGMPGLGKTTLAKKIYDDPTIVCNFPVRLWCSVSRAYQKRGLVLDILRSMGELTDDMCKEEAEDLQKALYQLLREKEKYLIIMDDVWDTKPWDDFQHCFADCNAGSRIIFTSRTENLDLHCESHAKFTLALLHEEVCWRLLEKIVFQNEKCPPELEEDGKEIARKCQGLPLLVHLVAGLVREERQPSTWRNVSRTLSSIAGDSNVRERILEQTEKLLEQSYKNLPVIRRSCFLYCAGFPTEKKIPTRKLIRLWVAEGFVMETEQESLENAAEKWLTDLINSSLLLGVDRRTNGTFKTCRIHALVHDFCRKKADETSFLKVIDSSSAIYEQHRRLAITDPDCPDINESIPLGSHVCSLLGLFTYNFQEGLSEISPLLRCLKLLKVLDLESINIFDFPREIGKLVLLKYLAIRGDFSTFPTSIGNLCYLETFILHGHVSGVSGVDDNLSGLLDAIHGMPKVRHLQLASEKYPIQLQKNQHKTYEFQTVQTLSGVHVNGLQAEDSLRCFPNLGKLKCTFGVIMTSSSTSRFPILEFLQKLEILHVSYKSSWGQVRPAVATLRLPASVRQLTLSSLGLPWKEMSELGRSLPMLEILKLLNDSFVGEEWDMDDDNDTDDEEVKFPNLKFLKLQSLDIRKWKIAYGDQFPMLKQLELRQCSRLEEIPTDSFAEMDCLKEIHMQGCTRSAIKSAKIFEQKQVEYDENFKLVIHA